MADTSVDCGHGTQVIFATSGFTAQLVEIRLRSLARSIVQSSHMGTTAASAGQFGNRTAIPGQLESPGQLVMDAYFNPQTNPPIAARPEAITIRWPLPTGAAFGAVWEMAGFLVNLDIVDSQDEAIAVTATVQLTAPIRNLPQEEITESYAFWEATWDWPDLLGPLTEYYTGSWE